jgi:hypothetical protein
MDNHRLVQAKAAFVAGFVTFVEANDMRIQVT